MRYILIATLFAAAGVHAQTPSPGAPAPAAAQAAAQVDTASPDKIRQVLESLKPGEKFIVERTDGPNLKLGPALGGNTQVLMPAHAVDSLVSSQTNLINQLMAKVRELEARVQKLEKGGR